MPLIMAREQGQLEKITIVVSPLTQLGKQTYTDMEKAKIPAIALNSENMSDGLMKVSPVYFRMLLPLTLYRI
jgi:superfamily II DNA helicase RecQ